MNKGFLFATSSRMIESYVVESQITLLVWSCWNHLRENIAHMIIFSGLSSKLYQWSIREAYMSMFFGICLGKKNAEVIKFLGILKKYVSEKKILFCSEKKSNVSLNEKSCLYFCLSLNFQTWFHKADHLLYYPHMSVFSFHTFFVLIYQSLRNGT